MSNLLNPSPDEGYPWPCAYCGRNFIPRRLQMLPHAPLQKVCSTCAWEGLLKFVNEPEPEEGQ